MESWVPHEMGAEGQGRCHLLRNRAPEGRASARQACGATTANKLKLLSPFKYFFWSSHHLSTITRTRYQSLHLFCRDRSISMIGVKSLHCAGAARTSSRMAQKSSHDRYATLSLHKASSAFFRLSSFPTASFASPCISEISPAASSFSFSALAIFC